MGDSTADRLRAIGRKDPDEIFEQCISLHGEMIQYVHKRSDEDFKSICEDIYNYIKLHSDVLSEYQIGDYKILLNHRVQQGIQTVGNHKGVLAKLQELKVDQETLVHKQDPDLQTCLRCGDEKHLEQFPDIRSGGKGAMCKTCRGTIESEHRAKKKVKLVFKPEFETLMDSQEDQANQEAHLKRKREEYKDELEQDETDIIQEDEGKGLYFMSSILKDKISGQYFNFIDQVWAESQEEAYVKFSKSKELTNSIIISTIHEKSICDLDDQPVESKD